MYISILIPLYNGIEYLNNCINSVLLQTYDKWEIIVGINGHDRNSNILKLAENICKNKNKNKIRVIWYNTDNKPKTLNKMLKDTKYDLICLLDVDDIWEPQKLEKQIEIKKKYNPDVIGTLCQYFGNSNIIPKIPINKINSDIFLKINPIINSSCMINKSDAIASA